MTAPYRIWGEGLEPSSIQQLLNGCSLPVAAAGALMPDAHVGYGLPIGGVLATRGAVIPYAVGVDIACRMKLTVLDLPASELERDEGRKRLSTALERETRFGVGAEHKKRKQHAVLDRDWNVSPITKANREKAHAQLGTSGSGNHFVEFGTLTVEEGADTGPSFDLAPGKYLSVLSHSGSRGTGAAICDHYSKRAMKLRPDLPPEQRHLAWLELGSEDGREYWDAMELMGHYASANHALIHEAVLKHLGASALAGVENHHNYAWKERHVINGVTEDVVVHRKGATPAGKGVLGMIPGSMATPGFVVRGKGNPESLNSAAHGAGRVMSRTKAREAFRWDVESPRLKKAGVTLLSAGLDEVPGVYKDIHAVMAAQADLVDVVARFDPSIVKMSPAGERPED